MVNIIFDEEFQKVFSKIKDQGLKDKIKKQLKKIITDPEIGKPMRYSRKGTREVYVSPYRVSYEYSSVEQTIIFLTIYHKDEQ